VESLQLQATIKPEFGLGIACLALSADGLRLAIVGKEPHNQLHIYDWRTVCRHGRLSASLSALQRCV
jgi:hypothetical protein